jgi:hypothetical protein
MNESKINANTVEVNKRQRASFANFVHNNSGGKFFLCKLLRHAFTRVSHPTVDRRYLKAKYGVGIECVQGWT